MKSAACCLVVEEEQAIRRHSESKLHCSDTSNFEGRVGLAADNERATIPRVLRKPGGELPTIGMAERQNAQGAYNRGGHTRAAS